jgi:hypothetical protein
MPISEGGPPLLDGANGSSQKHVRDEPPASSQSLLAKLVRGEGRTDFRHPAAADEQRPIWLPKDPIGLVKEIERDLDSQDILHSTEGATMNVKGHVDVTLILEDAQDAPAEG